MEPWKCEPCGKSFSGLICFQQHEASEKHKKKLMETESWKCEPCGKSFTGLVCFQQHEASEKHKKKVQSLNGANFEKPNSVNPLNSRNQIHCSDNPEDSINEIHFSDNPSVSINHIHCSICQVSISGLDNYLKHSNSLEHALMVQMKNNDLLSSSVSSTFELRTERNQLLQATVPLASPTKAVASFAECKPCGKEFSGPEPYQQHLLSAGHRKKCGPSPRFMPKDETDSIIRKENIDDNLPNESLSSVSMHNHNGTDPQIFAKCDVCEMKFNGALPYQIHLVSDEHKMKARCGSLGNTLAESQNAFKCDICLMTFTGPKPYEQHIVSNGHRKKMLTADLSKQVATPPGSALENSHIAHEQTSIFDQRWYCDTCKIQCTGSIPFNTHINGKEHSKSVRKQIVEENLKKIKASGALPYVGNNEIGSDSSNKVTSTSNLNSEYETPMEERDINNLNVNSDDTKVFSNKFQVNDLIALPNLNIIPPEKLDIAVFQPDEEIIFSNFKKYY